MPGISITFGGGVSGVGGIAPGGGPGGGPRVVVVVVLVVVTGFGEFTVGAVVGEFTTGCGCGRSGVAIGSGSGLLGGASRSSLSTATAFFALPVRAAQPLSPCVAPMAHDT